MFRKSHKGEVMGTSKILIVEDEPNMVAGLRDNFEYEGFQVITALDGVEGLERGLKDSPDLVVLDVMMPRMSGLDVCKQLKAKRPSIPITMLTARGQEVDKVVGLELGADDYVTKPFSIRELLARVRRFCDAHTRFRKSRTVIPLATSRSICAATKLCAGDSAWSSLARSLSCSSTFSVTPERR